MTEKAGSRSLPDLIRGKDLVPALSEMLQGSPGEIDIRGLNGVGSFGSSERGQDLDGRAPPDDHVRVLPQDVADLVRPVFGE